MAQIEIVSEEEASAGWAFTAQVLDDEGGLHPFRLTLAWADYNLWSAGGADEPARVAAAVIRFLVSRIPAGELKASFDASIARRLFVEADEMIPGLIG